MFHKAVVTNHERLATMLLYVIVSIAMLTARSSVSSWQLTAVRTRKSSRDKYRSTTTFNFPMIRSVLSV